MGWFDELGVSEEEMVQVYGQLRGPLKAGSRRDSWPHVGLGLRLDGRLRQFFTNCLKLGQFPQEWKTANMVLLHKEGRRAESPSAYRLLNDAGKMLERVIVLRVIRHLCRMGPDLHPGQYGFLKGCSTVGTIQQFWVLAGSIVREERMVLAISLDIVNAFNNLPLDEVVATLAYHGMPNYLVSIIENYFRHRILKYRDRDGAPREREMSCGVPQGSVLGPLLWDIAYDKVLRQTLSLGCHTVCYANDTL